MIRTAQHRMPGRSVVRIAALLVLIGGLAACGKEEAKAPEARLVNVVRVNPGSGSSEVAYSGDVRARYA